MTAHQIAGALGGLAAGDVLGSGYEGLRSAEFAPATPHLLMPVPGSVYTDDTQQALVVALHLAVGDLDPERLAFDLAYLDGDSGRASVYRGTGTGFRSFVAHLREGADFTAASQPSGGNGAAMRAAPIAIRHHDDLAEAMAATIEASLVTHADPRGVAAAAAVVAAVWVSARGQTGADVVQAAMEGAADVEHALFADYYERLSPGDHWHDMSAALRDAVDLVGAEPGAVAASIGDRASRTSSSGIRTGTDTYAPASVATAITLAATPADADPSLPVRHVVCLGGDTDTMGAIAGAIVGARHGIMDWPWSVPNKNVIDALGMSLVGAGPAPPGLRSLDELYILEAQIGHHG